MYEMSYLGQSVHNYPKGIIFRLSPSQSHDKIHSSLFLLPLRCLQRLQHPSRSLLLDLDSLTGVVKDNILDNISLHFIPPIGCFEIMVHLIPSWVNGISGLVSLSIYLILQLLNVRHTNPFLVPQHSLVIFHKFERLLFLDIALSLLNLLVFQLTFLNILK
jgi:hypothetical protein